MSKRFVRRGVSKFLFSPTPPADPTTVLRTELDAATDLSPDIADVNGWQLEGSSVPTPDMGSDFTGSIPGEDTVNDSSFTFYEDLDAETIETLLPKGTTGTVYILRKGDKAGSNSLDVFPVRVSTRGSEISVGNDPARMVIQFNITDRPELDTPIPA